MTSVTKQRPVEAYKALTELKYDLLESGLTLEYFHAAEDTQAVRDQVFAIKSRASRRRDRGFDHRGREPHP